MWSVTNYFLVNLTLADLMMSILNCIPSFIFMRDRYYILFSILKIRKLPESEECWMELTGHTKDAAITCPYRKSLFHGQHLDKMLPPMNSWSAFREFSVVRRYYLNLWCQFKLLSKTLILTAIYSNKIFGQTFLVFSGLSWDAVCFLNFLVLCKNFSSSVKYNSNE